MLISLPPFWLQLCSCSVEWLGSFRDPTARGVCLSEWGRGAQGGRGLQLLTSPPLLCVCAGMLSRLRASKEYALPAVWTSAAHLLLLSMKPGEAVV